MPRVTDYVRQSARRESGSEASPATQRAANERRANEIHDAVWVCRFEDIGISGYKNVERPSSTSCVPWSPQAFDIVIVHYMSRLTRRDVKLSLPLLMGWLAAGATIISVNEGVYRNDKHWRSNLADHQPRPGTPGVGQQVKGSSAQRRPSRSPSADTSESRAMASPSCPRS